MDKLLPVIEVARRVGVSRVQVFYLIRDRKLKAEKVGRNYVIRESDLEDYTINRAVGKAIEDFGDTLLRLEDS